MRWPCRTCSSGRACTLGSCRRSMFRRWPSPTSGAVPILMGKHAVEGVYDGDPRREPDAEFLPELTHLQAIERGLRVMDTTALSLCMDNALPIYVFALADGNIK